MTSEPYVPVVVVIRRSDLERMQTWAAARELAGPVREAIAELTRRNGWTEEMLKYGSLLSAAIEDITAPQQPKEQR